jgi:hypothetical protein
MSDTTAKTTWARRLRAALFAAGFTLLVAAMVMGARALLARWRAQAALRAATKSH